MGITISSSSFSMGMGLIEDDGCAIAVVEREKQGKTEDDFEEERASSYIYG